jgi:amino acid transporter
MNHSKFGTFYGIFIPNVTMMFGVIIFLRLSVVTGTLGLENTFLILTLSFLFMLITSASTTMLATNMDVGPGGVYYIIGRLLGLKIGGAVGIATYLTQTLTIAFCTSAFSYTLVSMIPSFSLVATEIFTLCLLTLLSSYSAKSALRAQGFILLLLLTAILSIFLGLSFNPSKEITSHAPAFFPSSFGFWQGFSIVYGAFTGIEAGMALSGNLKNPARSLRIGNPSSLIFVFITYCLIATTTYFFFSSDALKTDPFLLLKISWPPGLVSMGVCAATLSSALGALLGGPRILQSLSQDQITPKLFAKSYGPLQEPRYAIGLTFCLSLILVLSTDIDQIIPIYTMICLINYGLLNLTAFISTKINAPSWRPDYKVHKSIPLLGLLLSLFFMLMISLEWSFIAIFTLLTLHGILNRTEAANQILGIKRSIWFWLMRKGLYNLEANSKDTLTWHPCVLALSVSPTTYPRMAKLAKHLTHENGLLTFGTVLPANWESPERLEWNKKTLTSYFKEKRVNCLVATHVAETPYQGFINLVKTHGVGLIEPNSILLPLTSHKDMTPEFLDLVKTCYATKKNLLLYFPDQSLQLDIETIKKPSHKKVIDVWWNSEDRKSTDLMMNYLEIFYSTSSWKNSQVTLNASAKSKMEKENVCLFLSELIKLNKLDIQVKVHKRTGSSSKTECVLENSNKEDVTFQVLPAYSEDMNDMSYMRQIKTLLKKSEKMQSDCLFFSCYDTINHGNLLK